MKIMIQNLFLKLMFDTLQNYLKLMMIYYFYQKIYKLENLKTCGAKKNLKIFFHAHEWKNHEKDRKTKN